jgi:hypothetical protein
MKAEADTSGISSYRLSAAYNRIVTPERNQTEGPRLSRKEYIARSSSPAIQLDTQACNSP